MALMAELHLAVSRSERLLVPPSIDNNPDCDFDFDDHDEDEDDARIDAVTSRAHQLLELLDHVLTFRDDAGRIRICFLSRKGT